MSASSLSTRGSKGTIVPYPSPVKISKKKVSHSILGSSPTNACTHVCKYVNQKAWLPCWPSRGQEVLYQRWIWGIHCMQAKKHTSEEFENQGRHHQKSKTELSVVSQKDLCPLKIIFIDRKVTAECGPTDFMLTPYPASEYTPQYSQRLRFTYINFVLFSWSLCNWVYGPCCAGPALPMQILR